VCCLYPSQRDEINICNVDCRAALQPTIRRDPWIHLAVRIPRRLTNPEKFGGTKSSRWDRVVLQPNLSVCRPMVR